MSQTENKLDELTKTLDETLEYLKSIPDAPGLPLLNYYKKLATYSLEAASTNINMAKEFAEGIVDPNTKP